MLPLTKSDFLEYRHCAKAFWLKRHRPDEVEAAPLSAFDRMLMADGYTVEAEVRRLVESWPDSERCQFQVTYLADDQLMVRADLIKTLDDGSVDLFEIKSSTSIGGSGGDHVADACFQRIVMERSGVQVNAVHIIHVNGDYVRNGEIDPVAFLSIADVTEQTKIMRSGLEGQIAEALALIASDIIDEVGCTCRHLGNVANRCASFAHFNPDVPERSAHHLPRISSAKLRMLDAEGRLAIDAVTADDCTATQLPSWTAMSTGNQIINAEAIKRFVGGLEWPLHFYDYETFASAVPITDGYQPHRPIPVQFSLHKLQLDGTLEHFEFLADRPDQHGELVAALIAHTDANGHGVVWFETFEKTRNRELAGLHPEHAVFFESLNARTVDLMTPFKADYVHPEFRGSTSIKKVLPVLCPDLSYAGMSVHDGAGAMEAWRAMAEAPDEGERERLRADLLAYCKLDTLAMVRIFEFLRSLGN